MTTDNPRASYTTVEVAEMFNVSRLSIDRWIKAGRIPRPMKNPQSNQNLWTQTDIDNLARFLKEKDQDGAK